MPEIEFERELDRRFDALGGAVATIVPIPGAEEIIARGRRRRRNGHATVAGLAVLTVFAMGFLFLGPLRPDRGPLPPVDPTPTAARYTPPVGAIRDQVGAKIPPGFLPIAGPVVQGRLEPNCPGQAALSTNVEITASAAAADGSTKLLVYPVGLAANRAYEEYHDEVDRCATAAPGTRTVDELDFGAQGFQVVTLANARPVSYEAVVRYGRALLLVREATTEAVRHAGVIERSLCVFATDCAVRSKLPAPIPTIRVGGEAWAAVLAVSAEPDTPALGRAVSAASQLGYRSSVTSLGCDAGLPEALGLPAGSPHRHVAVYFDSRADAESFASAAHASTPEFVVAVVQVHTYCLG